MTMFDGLTSRVVETPRLAVGIVERDSDSPETPTDQTIVFVHGSDSALPVWQETMLSLPTDLRVIAVELREVGHNADLRADRTPGLQEHSDDLQAALEALRIPIAHFVGVDVGAGVVVHYALGHPVNSLALHSPTVNGVDLSNLTELDAKPPILWMHGAADSAPVVRDGLGAYTAAGGATTELTLEDAGDTARHAAEFRHALLSIIGYVGRPAEPAPTTEAIILRSAD